MSEDQKLTPSLSIKGYTDQSKAKQDLVNKYKELEERVLRATEEAYTIDINLDQRWLHIARTHIQQGFMALNRAVFQPTRISLPEDKPNE